MALGIGIIAEGNHRAAQDYYYSVVPWGFWGTVFILLPLIIGAVRVLVTLMRAAAGEHQRYRAWKASLTPEQRAAVELAEAAVAGAAAVAMWEHHRRADARLSASAMGQTPINDVHAGIMAATARLKAGRQAAQQAWTPPGATAASQAAIARHHPEHLDPQTGTYKPLPW
ncbi:MAG: hypothetical protein ACRDRJ_15125 [Streptosporangiaceae bacterium]